MTITLTAAELKQLETALATHYQTLDRKLSASIQVGGPNEAGIQQCIHRQQVRFLLDKLRLVQCEPNIQDPILGKTISTLDVSRLRGDRRTRGVAA